MLNRANLCALVPAFNEADVIAPVVLGIKEYIDSVFVIDDGSMDGTGEIAKNSGAISIRLDRNCGKGTAVRKGIETIRHCDFSHVLFIDGDGQHRPADIPILIQAACRDNADIVIGTRLFDRHRMPRERFLSNSIGSKATSLLLGKEIKDSQCGFRLIRLDKLLNLHLRAKKYEIEMEILIKMSLAGCSIAQAPIAMVYENDKASSKMHPIRDTVRICLWSLFFRLFNL